MSSRHEAGAGVLVTAFLCLRAPCASCMQVTQIPSFKPQAPASALTSVASIG